MADKGNDPAVLWQTMLAEMEKGFNAFGNQAMNSPEFSKAINQANGLSAGLQKQFGEMMEKYLAGMNLPSRSQMTSLGERLQSIESQLHEIRSLLRQVHHNSGAPEDGFGGRPKPPRTRQPPGAPAADGGKPGGNS